MRSLRAGGRIFSRAARYGPDIKFTFECARIERRAPANLAYLKVRGRGQLRAEMLFALAAAREY